MLASLLLSGYHTLHIFLVGPRSVIENSAVIQVQGCLIFHGSQRIHLGQEFWCGVAIRYASTNRTLKPTPQPVPRYPPTTNLPRHQPTVPTIPSCAGPCNSARARRTPPRTPP